MSLLTEGYSHFILFKGAKETLHSIEELRTLERPARSIGCIGDIFLIRKGAID